MAGTNSSGQTNDVCWSGLDLHSEGIWGLNEASNFLRHSLPRLQLQLAVIFTLTQSFHILFRRFHLPRIVSEILTGIILGPTLLGRISTFTEALFPPEGDIFLDTLSKVGYIFFMFLSGLKMDPRMIMTAGTGTMTAWTVGVLAPLIPFAGGMSLNQVYEERLNMYRWPAIKSIISTSNIYAFPVTFALLVDLKIMNSELGRLALTSTLISDLISNVMASVASNVRLGYVGIMIGVGIVSAFLSIFAMFLLIGLARPFAHWIIKRTPEGKPVDSVYVILMAIAVLLSVIITDNTGLGFQYGPFILGLALPDGPPLGATVVDKLETLNSGLFVPLLVTYCGMKVNLVQLYDLDFMKDIWIIFIVCVGMKFCSILFPALICKVPVKDATALACIMCTQGVVQMAFYFGHSISQTFDGETFSMATLSVWFIAGGTQLCAKSLYDYSRVYTGYQKRDIQHVSPNSELRVLTCAHQIDDVFAVKKMLEPALLNKESPIALYALSLVELVGRAHPLLIDHQLGQKTAMIGSSSRKIIELFQSFGQQYYGLVSVQVFTAMSLHRFMQHDICSLAFDKLASFIILPFHRKWNHQGKMVQDSSIVRVMNCHVFDMAPCSVGILVDRHKIRHQASDGHNVAVVFIGGADDREALAYGKRVARSAGVHLTIIRFVPVEQYNENQWDAVLDAEILKETRLQGTHQDNIVYREEGVRDGAETALHIHALEDAFDLIVIGRRHREEAPQLLGLNEWNDLPELGPIGDMLASSEVNKPASVLVVQQQIVRTK